MRLDLFLRVRRDRINLAIRLRLIAGGAIIVSIALALTGFAPHYLAELHQQPLIVIAPAAPVPPAAASWWPAW